MIKFMTGFAELDLAHGVMMLIGLIFIYLGVVKKWEPYELLPIGCGMILANFPLTGLLTPPSAGLGPGQAGMLGIILKYGLYQWTLLPQFIFFCIGAMTDFGPLIANPRSFILGAAAQIGIYFAMLGAVLLGFSIPEACSIGIIGGADGPTTLYTTGILAPEIMGITATAAYSYMAMVAIIQPPIINALTTKKERQIYMKPMLRPVSRTEKLLFPIITMFLVVLIMPKSGPLIGTMMVGNLFRESGVVPRLSETAQNSLMNIVTIFLMLGIGASMPAEAVLKTRTLLVLLLGLVAFAIGTAGGVIMGKIYSKISKEPFNPIIGAAGVSAVPMAARIVQHLGQKENKQNFLLMHAMGPNVAGVVGSAIAGGYFLSLFMK